jgi:hypothetical protein
MYCSSCGAESIQGLKYCKHCGANMTPAESLMPISNPRGLVWIVAFGILMMLYAPMAGIGIVFMQIPNLFEKGFPLWFLMALAIISLLMMSVATVLISRLLSPLFKAYLQSGEATETKRPKLSGSTRTEINAPRDSASSVTEETTRRFESLNKERNTN